jgi:hypothetical protein
MAFQGLSERAVVIEKPRTLRQSRESLCGQGVIAESKADVPNRGRSFLSELHVLKLVKQSCDVFGDAVRSSLAFKA